ncbi:MAG: ACP S-malonyltransferase [Planctomycetota bacterium]
MTSEISNQKSEILLCPGQGAQHVGMAKAWFDAYPVAKQTFAAADQHLGFDLAGLCFSGPEEKLNRTDMAQVAIYVASVAGYQALVETGGVERANVAATAGLSLGEFTALHLAGAYDFLEGLELVRLRGRAMQDAAEASQGSMVAITGDVSEDAIVSLCQRAVEQAGSDEVLVPANYNSAMQVVVSGSIRACEAVVPLASEAGFKPTPLTVAGAFHSPLMQPAADRLAEALADVNWQTPRCPVYSNVTGEPHDSDANAIQDRLVKQLTHPVRWSQSMAHAAQAFPANAHGYAELPPGKVLTGLMRRIDKSVKVKNLAEPA